MTLPEAVLREYVWPWSHQMCLREALNSLERGGPSLWEDLPARYHPLAVRGGTRGWSVFDAATGEVGWLLRRPSWLLREPGLLRRARLTYQHNDGLF